MCVLLCWRYTRFILVSASRSLATAPSRQHQTCDRISTDYSPILRIVPQIVVARLGRPVCLMTTQSLGNVRCGLHPVQKDITNNGTQCGFFALLVGL